MTEVTDTSSTAVDGEREVKHLGALGGESILPCHFLQCPRQMSELQSYCLSSSDSAGASTEDHHIQRWHRQDLLTLTHSTVQQTWGHFP